MLQPSPTTNSRKLTLTGADAHSVERNTYRPKDRLAEVEEDGSINYTKFLERYRVQVREPAHPSR